MSRYNQPAPSIVVEDVDRIQARLDFQSPPSHQLKIQDNNNCHTPLSLSTSFGIIQPDVDAYVTPLSLCHQPSVPVSLPLKDKVIVVSGGSMPPCMVTSGSESSFTSVDIGGPHHPTTRSSVCDNDSSWNSNVSLPTTGCFDLKSGLICVTRAITSSVDPRKEKCNHHQVDITDNSSLEVEPIKSGRSSGPGQKKRMSVCSMLGIFFICLAVVGLVAIGIAMYIEFVSKPSWIAKNKQPILNETTICDYLLDSCGNSTSLPTTASEVVDGNQTNFTLESGRVEATFSSNFTSQISGKLPAKTA